MPTTTTTLASLAAAAAMLTAGAVAATGGGTYDAAVVSFDIPARLAPGQATRFKVVVKNTGTMTWDDGYRLGVVDDLAGDGARFIETTGAEPNRVHLPPGKLVPPGDEHEFSFAVLAPAATRVYSVRFRMLHEGVDWFGERVEKAVTVAAALDAARLVRFDAPDRISPGERATFRIVLRNAGTSTWDTAMRLGVVDEGAGDGARFLEGTGRDAIRVNLPAGVRVAPGQEQELAFDVVAPAQERAYSVRFRMVHEGVQWFGDTAEKGIVVAKGTPPPAANDEDAALTRIDMPDALPPGARTRLKVTLRNLGRTTWTAGPYRLGVVGDGAGDAARFIETTGAEPNRVHLPAGASVAPGQEHEFGFDVIAPNAARVYDLRFQMIHEGVTWFGPVVAKSLEVAVGAAPPQGAPARRGRVRAAGRCLMDDDGTFNALGATLFWAAWAYKNDRPKLERALSFLSRNGFDYIRAFGQVGNPQNPTFWANRIIDASDPTLPATLAGVTDLAYDSYGIRVEWTIFASADVIPTRARRQAFVDTCLAMSKGREHKIIHFEIANEFWQTGFPGPAGLDELRFLTKYLNDRTDILVAASAPDGFEGSDLQRVYRGNIADIGTIHFDRDVRKADGPWRPVRQPWEYVYAPDVPAIGSNNEPIGPGSSVAQDDDPMRLVSGAIASYVSGLSLYVYHAHAGIRGLAGEGEVSDLPAASSYNALRKLVPSDLPNWSRKNAHWADSPFKVYARDAQGRLYPDSMWPDMPGGSTGAVRAYGAVKGNDFFVYPMGIRGSVRLEARRAMSVELFDPISGDRIDGRDIGAGQAFEVSGRSAVVLKGRYK